MMEIDEKTVRAAVKARKPFILENLNTMTLKSCRRLLEDDLGVEAGALKAHKELLSALIDRYIAKSKASSSAEVGGVEEEQPPEHSKKKKKKAAVSEADEEVKPRKKAKQNHQQPAKPSGPRQYSRTVEKLRSICKAATITIPPSTYSRNKGDGELQGALEALLEKHGLDINSGDREIQRAKSRLQTQRDLDGIDTSNIISGGRGRRGAAPVSYKALVQPASDSEDEDEDKEEEEEEEEEAEGGAAASGEEDVASSGSDADLESEPETGGSEDKQQAAASKLAKTDKRRSEPQRKPKRSSSTSDVGDDAAGQDGATRQRTPPTATKSKTAAAQAARSPNENVAGNSGSEVKRSKAAALKPAAGLEDSDGERPGGRRRALAEWSDDE